MHGFKVVICSLNQWALDFEGNVKRIKESIDIAMKSGAVLRSGPELEVCGYSLEDSFFEQDTVYHSWCALLDILVYTANSDLIIDLGMPVHNTALYNCRVICRRGKILLIRAKTSLAHEGNYRESRHFSPWPLSAGAVAYRLPSFVAEKLSQQYVPFGADFILEMSGFNRCDTIRIGWEICQELWDSNNVSSDLYQNYDCHLILNGSGSYWELRKLNTVLDMVKGVSLRGGACYAFSNLLGCDGQRYVFYGRSCFYDRGQLVAMTPIGTDNLLKEVQTIEYTVRPRVYDEHRAQKGARARYLTGQNCRIWDLENPVTDITQLDGRFKRFFLKTCQPKSSLHQISKSAEPSENLAALSLEKALSIRFEEQIYLYVPLWLWDYLRRSRMSGFMLPLSGGLDSSTVATLVFCMCKHIHDNIDSLAVKVYFREVHKISPEKLTHELSSPQMICRRLLKCRYLSTNFSGSETRHRAEALCDIIGADFSVLSIQDIYSRFKSLLSPGASLQEVSLLDQNLQARLRMVATYYLSEGSRIVLASGNVDESIMGYLTKYDCSSADINPIGGLCKNDLKSFLLYCQARLDDPVMADVLKQVIEAPPSAELTGAEQRDEDEIGITYDEISILGRVRRGQFACSGPSGAFETIWNNKNQKPFRDNVRCLKALADGSVSVGQTAHDLADLIKRFYQRYAKNRHKLTVLTPALHAETYSPDDNRYDHRQFLYPPWTEQFKRIDRMVESIYTTGNLPDQ